MNPCQVEFSTGPLPEYRLNIPWGTVIPRSIPVTLNAEDKLDITA